MFSPLLLLSCPFFTPLHLPRDRALDARRLAAQRSLDNVMSRQELSPEQLTAELQKLDRDRKSVV